LGRAVLPGRVAGLDRRGQKKRAPKGPSFMRMIRGSIATV
jgi:hypothetical protein